MKTAIYIEDGTVQLVITPQNDFEKNALSTLRKKKLSAKLFDGAFYDCRGGWIRQEHHSPYNAFVLNPREDKSLIIRVDEIEPEEGGD